MSLVNLQQKIGVTADGAFGPGTFKKAAAFYKLSPNRAAHFFAQTAHESGGFKAFSENLDGWKYRGRGALQLTGKANYQAFADYIGRPEVVNDPDLVAGELCFESALWFFDRNKLWSICDQGINDTAILALTKRINGGTHGLDDRKLKTKKYAKWL